MRFLLASLVSVSFLCTLSLAAKFLPHRWAANAREFLRIEKIVGRRVYLQTTDIATGERPNYNFSVIVTRDGDLTAYEASAKK